MVCTLLDNDIRHRSGQNVVDSQDAADWVRNNCNPWPLRDTLKRAALSVFLSLQQQIGQLDRDITANCGKKVTR